MGWQILSLPKKLKVSKKRSIPLGMIGFNNGF
jgi:hypothetical protein